MNANIYVQWAHHRMQELSMVSTESLNNTRPSNDEHEDDEPRDVSELSSNKYDEDVNEFQSRYDHRVIRDLSNNSGDEDDASTKVLETNDEE